MVAIDNCVEDADGKAVLVILTHVLRVVLARRLLVIGPLHLCFEVYGSRVGSYIHD
jgi:hypothetical protein